MNNIVLGTALLCCAFGALAQSVRTDRAAIANGESVYLRIGCQACHGTVGQGGAGVRLSPSTLPLEAFRIWVRNGTPGWSFSRGMPGFSPEVISDMELADVHAFLVSLPPPRAVEDIPLLNP